jgi:hypothetical protein
VSGCGINRIGAAVIVMAWRMKPAAFDLLFGSPISVPFTLRIKFLKMSNIEHGAWRATRHSEASATAFGRSR